MTNRNNKSAWMECLLLYLLATWCFACTSSPGPDSGTTESKTQARLGSAKASAPKGYALAIGLNSVDPQHYAGWNDPLDGCESDVDVMKQIASSQGFDVELLKTKQATRAAVLKKLKEHAEKLEPGDLFVLSYSGHGGMVRDENGDEDDGRDETWCLYDGQMLDDELHDALSKFKKGVRILSFSDSCHSGTVLKTSEVEIESTNDTDIQKLERAWTGRSRAVELEAEVYLGVKGIPGVRDPNFKAPKPKIRAMPPDIAVKTYTQNQAFYDKLGKDAPKEDPKTFKASLIHISGCEDDQFSEDWGFNGLFTTVLKIVWAKGGFDGDHRKFHEKIREKVLANNPTQSPNFFTINENETFIKQKPYTVIP